MRWIKFHISQSRYRCVLLKKYRRHINRYAIELTGSTISFQLIDLELDEDFHMFLSIPVLLGIIWWHEYKYVDDDRVLTNNTFPDAKKKERRKKKIDTFDLDNASTQNELLKRYQLTTIETSIIYWRK